MIHGLIERSQVDYDFYNVAVSPVYDMNLYIVFLFLNMLLFNYVLFFKGYGTVLERSTSILPKAL